MHGNKILGVESSPKAAAAALKGKVRQTYIETIDHAALTNPAQAHAQAAFRNARVPAISEATVLAMSLDEAHDRIKPVFETLRTRNKKGEFIVPSYVKSPTGLADSLISTNAKLDKEATKPASPYSRIENVQIRGLNLIPSNFLPTRFVRAYPDHPLTQRIRALGLSPRFTTCSGSSPACRSSCLLFTGNHAANAPYGDTVKAAKLLALLENPVAFLRLLLEGLERATKKDDYHLYFRMNLLSDIPWELICPWLFERYSQVQFYDYTKVQGRDPGSHYDLTFSYSGKNEKASRHAHTNGQRVALVLVGIASQSRKGQSFQRIEQFPSDIRLWGSESLLVDGDVHDARPLDPPDNAWKAPVAVGLRWKIPIGAEDAREQLETSVEDGFVTPAFPLEDSKLRLRGIEQNPSQTLFAAPVTPRYSLHLEGSELAG